MTNKFRKFLAKGGVAVESIGYILMAIGDFYTVFGKK